MASEDILPFPSAPHHNSSISSTELQWPTALAFNATTNSDISFDHTEVHHRYISRGGQIFMTGVYIFGAAANIFSLLLLSQGKQARNRKLTLMIRCLAANDLMALCSSFFLVYMRIYLEPSFVASRWFCGLRVLTRFFGFSSGSVASVMAVERFIALTRPFFYQKVRYFYICVECFRILLRKSFRK
ncbi:g_PROTEIN_RECEP_F1_2 domain-containing protein [Trichonephila inaurata madagascariensis]|uniref:G_PROTEIN_RECEP_F1_2 domain-containing protein n=1 Tax=Trichonephila inaurata madagascariensis TaxID=2747483 RepID=A0A8X6WTM8_9ARAC|nr:g_PROTEIN_RECEP_F1_2 domain-containing protein [Trichonephila inaurata madagascariensis]